MKTSDCLGRKCNAECCRIESLIPISVYDVFEISKHLKIPPQKFFNTYCVTTQQGSYHYLALDCTKQHKCPFLKNNKCSIYKTRPLICRLTLEAENVKGLYGGFENFKASTPKNCYVRELEEWDADAPEKKHARLMLAIAARQTEEYCEKHDWFDEKTARKTYEETKAQIKNKLFLTYLSVIIALEEHVFALLWKIRSATRKIRKLTHS